MYGAMKDKIPFHPQSVECLALRNAVAQQRLEGLHVSDATITDMERAIQGEISPEDVIAKTVGRYSRVSQIQS